MKKITFFLVSICFILISCESEQIENESFTEVKGKAKLNNSSSAKTFDFVDQNCTYSETELIAGQNMNVGTVSVSVLGQNYVVTYNVIQGYCITETHLSVVEDPNDFPMTKKGNPKNGNFQYSGSHECVSSVSYEVPISNGQYIAAHAVVNCESYSLEEIAQNLPETVDFCTSVQGPGAYLNISVEGGFLSGNYESWCIDNDLPIYLNKCYSDVPVYLSNATLPNDAFEYPENFDKVNWLLNQGLVGSMNSKNEVFTYGDLQFAIWKLLDDVEDDTCPNCSLGEWSIERSNELIALADLNGGGFIPDCGQSIGVILRPAGIQPLIFSIPINCNECEETAWAKGCDFPGNNWAMYFRSNE